MKVRAMSKPVIIVAAIAAALTMSTIAKANDGPSLGSATIKWTTEEVTKYKLTQDGCRNYAIETLSRAHVEGLDLAEKTIFGTMQYQSSAYTVSIRCEIDNRIAIMSIAGDNAAGIDVVLKQLQAAWWHDDAKKEQDVKQPRSLTKSAKKQREERVD
jgi:hypothetical protein